MSLLPPSQSRCKRPNLLAVMRQLGFKTSTISWWSWRYELAAAQIIHNIHRLVPVSMLLLPFLFHCLVLTNTSPILYQHKHFLLLWPLTKMLDLAAFCPTRSRQGGLDNFVGSSLYYESKPLPRGLGFNIRHTG